MQNFPSEGRLRVARSGPFPGKRYAAVKERRETKKRLA